MVTPLTDGVTELEKENQVHRGDSLHEKNIK